MFYHAVLEKPALPRLQTRCKKLRRVGAVLGLIEFKKHLSVRKFSQDFDLSPGRGHAVADAFPLSILHVFCLVHDPYAPLQRHLELVLYTAHRTALENVVRNDACRSQIPQEPSQHLRVIIDAF